MTPQAALHNDEEADVLDILTCEARNQLVGYAICVIWIQISFNQLPHIVRFLNTVLFCQSGNHCGFLFNRPIDKPANLLFSLRHHLSNLSNRRHS